MDRLESIINADVLDAWFPPSPKAVEAIQSRLPVLLRTSPPSSCQGMCEAIATARGVPFDCVLPGAGSSDLIFRALGHWLTPHSTALILDPTYGEYAHVLERVIGCHVERLCLDQHEDYRLKPDDLAFRLADGYDLVVVVNPNSPTGQHVPREILEPVLRQAPWKTRVWVDETYVDYVGPRQSLEAFASRSENVVVCKTLSKTYALSGARAAYLCGSPHQLEPLRAITPPWGVNLMGQIAAVHALADQDYYAARYQETHALRAQLSEALTGLGWHVNPSTTNFLLCHLPADGTDAQTLIKRCREHGLFLRDMTAMSPRLGNRVVRIAVKDAATNVRMLEILREVR
jgi:histidinol-phosphate/aromatic aminotransferase/cobyric acid decarboxylase-like protein